MDLFAVGLRSYRVEVWNRRLRRFRLVGWAKADSSGHALALTRVRLGNPGTNFPRRWRAYPISFGRSGP